MQMPKSHRNPRMTLFFEKQTTQGEVFAIIFLEMQKRGGTEGDNMELENGALNTLMYTAHPQRKEPVKGSGGRW